VITGERSGRPVINRRKDQGCLLITGEVSGKNCYQKERSGISADNRREVRGTC
jgi:hypothetical protein